MSEKKEHEFKDDGYTYCPECNGTKFGPNMNDYAKYLPLDLLKDTGMCFCEFCGRKGKIDYISYARGEGFIGESKHKIDCHSSEKYVVLVNDFIFIYTLFNIDGIISQISNKYSGNLEQIREIINDWVSAPMHSKAFYCHLGCGTIDLRNHPGRNRLKKFAAFRSLGR